jgi:hypothetical protein
MAKLTKVASEAQAAVAASLADSYVQEVADPIAEDHVRRWGFAHDQPTRDKDGRSSVQVSWLGSIKGDKHREIAVSVAAEEGKPTATAVFRDGLDRHEKVPVEGLDGIGKGTLNLAHDRRRRWMEGQLGMAAKDFGPLPDRVVFND